MLTLNLPVPVFNYGSKELKKFREFHSFNQLLEAKDFLNLGHYFYFNKTKVDVLRQVWHKSGIGYVINHGNFYDFRISVTHKQHSEIVSEWKS